VSGFDLVFMVQIPYGSMWLTQSGRKTAVVRLEAREAMFTKRRPLPPTARSRFVVDAILSPIGESQRNWAVNGSAVVACLSANDSLPSGVYFVANLA
jgi:hypothetical protein